MNQHVKSARPGSIPNHRILIKQNEKKCHTLKHQKVYLHSGLVSPAAPVIQDPPLGHMDRFGKPFLGFLAVLLLDSLAERPHIELLNGVPFEFVGVGIGESPCRAGLEGHNQTVWLSGCPQGKPGSTGVHRGELPLAPAFMLIDEWAD